MAEVQLEASLRDSVRKVLYRGQPGTSDTLLYTSPNFPGARTEVARIVVANTDSSARTFRIHAVPKGGSSTTSNALFYDVSQAGNATTVHDVRGLVLEEGEMLRAQQGTADKICLTVTGVQELRVAGVQ